jgi:hypothetical protein
MAYGEKYKLEFSDVYSNVTSDYVATIYKKDFTGDIIELNGTGNPLTIETQRDGESSYNPIIGSIAKLNLLIKDISGLDQVWEDNLTTWDLYDVIWDNTGLDILELINAELDEYYLEIKKNGDVIWKGYYITNSDVSIREISPIEFNMVFSDVSLIKSVKYFESDEAREVQYEAKDIVSLENLIIEGLNAFELFDEYRIEVPYTFYGPYSGINDSGTIIPEDLSIDEVYLQRNSLLDNLGNYMFNYDILNGICVQFGLMCYQKLGKLYISSYENLVNNNTRVYKKYTRGVGFTGTETITDTPVVLNSSTFRNLGRTQVIRYSQPTKYLQISSEVAKTTNNVNAFLWGENIYYDPDDPLLTPIKSLSGYDLQAGFTPPTRGVYATNSVSPFNFRFGLKWLVENSVFQSTKYMTSNVPVVVNQGDVVSLSMAYEDDARRDSIGDEIVVKTMLIFISNDIDKNPVTYYYHEAIGTFKVDIAYLTSEDIKNIKIPAKGELFMRLYAPYSPDYTPETTPYYAYIKYAILQTYKNNSTQGIYSNQNSQTFYDGIKLNKETQSFETTALIPDGSSYLSIIPYDGTVYNNPQHIVSTISNSLITRDYDIVLDYDTLAIVGIQRRVGEAIQKNNGVPNMIIEGDYKSSLYWIGDKFTYDPIGYDNVTFALLDFKFDLKQASQNSILYSSEFKNTTGLTLINKIITS